MNNQLITTEQSVSDAELIMHLENLGLLDKLSKGEKNTFVQIAKAYNLNPFKREIHVSKYGDKMSIITGYEVYIKRAERSGQLDGWSVKTTGNTKDGSLKATVIIHRKDRAHPFEWEANYKEFVQTTREGKVTQFWEKADFMIKKVAISQAFRLCFSDELGGMPYTKEELSDNTEDVSAEVLKSEVNKEQAPPKKVKFKDFNKALSLIKDGEAGFIEKTEAKYEFTPEQWDAWCNEKIRVENEVANTKMPADATT